MKLKLDSFSYRFLWKLKRYLGYQPGPSPIIWDNTRTHNLQPPETLWPHLNAQQTENLKQFQKELDILCKISKQIPRQFNEKHWKDLVHLRNTRERLEWVRFVASTQYKKQKDLREKLKKQATQSSSTNAELVSDEELDQDESNRLQNELKEIEELESRKDDDDTFVVNSIYSSYMYDYLKYHERNTRSMRMTQAFCMRENPFVVIDCRFLPDLTKRARNLTLLQLKHLLSSNKNREDPWPIIFANFDQTNELVQPGVENHLLQLTTSQEFVGDYTSRSYLDIFLPEKLIYLSPHAEEKLTAEEVLDDQNVFIIGGIVDRVPEPNIHPQASFMCAQSEGIRCRKFPLDDYMNWRAGKRFLTMTGVLDILQLVHDTRGNWAETFEHIIPVRNKKTQEERNPRVKQMSEDKRQHNREITRIVYENLNK